MRLESESGSGPMPTYVEEYHFGLGIGFLS